MTAASPRAHPAESVGLLGSLAIALAHGPFHIDDPTTLVYIGAAAGGVPAIITFVVTHKGLRGVLTAFWTGKR
jgi:hypothetical protein